MNPPSSSKGKERANDIEESANTATAVQLPGLASALSAIVNNSGASQNHDVHIPGVSSSSLTRPALLDQPGSLSESLRRSLQSYTRIPLQSPTGSSRVSTTISSSSSPISIQRMTFLRRYIQETMQKIEYATQKFNSITCRSEARFPWFAKLPTEIQLMIWDYAVPHARKISSAILVIVNHDLNEPKAILPQPKEYNKIHRETIARTIQAAADEGHELNFDLDLSEFQRESKHMVYTMMQTCHNSRIVTMRRFCLDINYPDPKALRKLPWSEDDDIYFPCHGFSFERRMAMQWLSRNRDAPPPSLATIQHIALPLERTLLQAFGVTRFLPDRNRGRNQWDNAWLKNMPNLKTFGLYLDPAGVSEQEGGELRLYEAEDVPVFYCSRYTPNEAEKAIEDKLDEIRGANQVKISTEVSVLCWKKPA